MIHTYILVLVIALVVAVALVVDEKHSTFVSTKCAPPVFDQKHTLRMALYAVYTNKYDQHLRLLFTSITTTFYTSIWFIIIIILILYIYIYTYITEYTLFVIIK